MFTALIGRYASIASSEDAPAHQPLALSRIHSTNGPSAKSTAILRAAREPAGVETSLGPFSEIIKAWQGPLPSIRQVLPARSFWASMDL
jgi:hypothetical protein